MRLRYIFLFCFFAVGAFGAGALWDEKKLWPYSLLGDVDVIAALKSRIIRPDSDIETSFATLRLHSITLRDQMSDSRPGGGIFAYDNRVIVMSFRGEFFLYKSVDNKASVDRLNIKIDNGYDLFQDFAERNRTDTKKASEAFRYMDVIYNQHELRPAILVSHHQWHDDRECFTLRLSALFLKPEEELEQVIATAEDWQSIYDTVPCMTMQSRAMPFFGRESGGRIVLENENSVLLSVGDHGFDGWNSDSIHAQDKHSDFGKILRIDTRAGTANVVSLGNRNPQGLAIDFDGNIWSTEHGPQGGDELNLIRQDYNYGWPLVTYGTQYGRQRWPLSEYQNHHVGYERPVLAWLPSIAVSNLIQVKNFVPEWEGDLLVSSLKDKTLHRLRYREGRVIFDEPIRVGLRVRDLDQLADGTIVFWADDTSLVEIRQVKSTEPEIDETLKPVRTLRKNRQY